MIWVCPKLGGSGQFNGEIRSKTIRLRGTVTTKNNAKINVQFTTDMSASFCFCCICLVVAIPYFWTKPNVVFCRLQLFPTCVYIHITLYIYIYTLYM